MIRRVLTVAVLAAALSGFASADGVVYNGCNVMTGVCTVTDSMSVSGIGLPASGQSLFTLDDFGALGLSGVTLTGASFDYQFDNVVSDFSVTNNASSAVAVDISVTSTPLLDSASTMFNKNNVKNGLDLSGASYTIADTGSVTINAGATYNASNSTFIDGIAANNNSGNCPGVVGTPMGTETGPCSGDFGDISNDLTLNPSNYNGNGTFTIGVVDTAAYSVGGQGATGSNLTVVFTTSYDGEAEITYDYTINSGVPEPTTLALLGSALLGLGLIGRKIRK